MPLTLSAHEARVLGCLLEKAKTTPDQYPLTLNALTNACNQKSSRDPVMALEPGEVEHTARALEDKHIVRVEENFKSQIHKFTHRFCNTPFSDYQFESDEYAVVCVLLLRGSRTPGELRSHCTRMHEFPDNRAVEDTLTRLIDMGIVTRLERAPGRRDHEYIHLFQPELLSAREVAAPPSSATPPSHAPAHTPTPSVADAQPAPGGSELEARVADLEQAVDELRALVSELRRAAAH